MRLFWVVLGLALLPCAAPADEIKAAGLSGRQTGPISEQISRNRVAAVKAAAVLDDADLNQVIGQLAKDDPDLAVRDAAIEASGRQ